MSEVMSGIFPESFKLFTFAFDQNLDLGGHAGVEFDWHAALAEVFDGMVEFNFASVNPDFVVFFETLGEVFGGDRAKEAVVSACFDLEIELDIIEGVC